MHTSHSHHPSPSLSFPPYCSHLCSCIHKLLWGNKFLLMQASTSRISTSTHIGQSCVIFTTLDSPLLNLPIQLPRSQPTSSHFNSHSLTPIHHHHNTINPPMAPPNSPNQSFNNNATFNTPYSHIHYEHKTFSFNTTNLTCPIAS